VGVLGLIALFTHIHAFWVAALILALIDVPDFGTPLRSIADSVEKIADATPGGDSEVAQPGSPPADKPSSVKEREHSHV
jgi:hypothetical protein